MEKEKEIKPTLEQIEWAIAILNAAGGFKIIRKIDKPEDIIY